MTTITARYQGDLRTLCTHTSSGQTLQTDAPVDNHGKGEFFSPTDLLATALGSCILTLMGIAAERLNVDITGATADVEKIMSTTPPRRVEKLSVHIHVPQAFEASAQEKLEHAAMTCPVHQSLDPAIEQHLIFHWGN